VLGWVTLKADGGNLAAPMLGHAAFNVIALAGLADVG
jgi:hypothetical protein